MSSHNPSSAASSASLTRTELNTHDTPFYLRFVERLYPGSPRWWSDDWYDHCGRAHGDSTGRLDRQPSFMHCIYTASMFEAGASKILKSYYNSMTPFLVTCVNPECSNRSWDIVETVKVQTSGGGTISKKFGDERERNDGLRAMATGDMRQFATTKCHACSHKRAVFGFSEIRNKWIYVLRESGDSLIPHQEIEMWDPNNGMVRQDYSGGKFGSTGKTFSGQLFLPNIKDHTWHFFLSPVRLGARALQLLQHAPKQDPQYAKKRDADDPARWHVPVLSDLGLQPWSTTVKRAFRTDQLIAGSEIIPLLDPFSWVAQMYEFDYLPIAAAQQQLLSDSDEQAKAFIAATLAQIMAGKRNEQDPAKITPDPWDVKEETVADPQAWVDRYHSAMSYVTKETNNAACRVSFVVRFSYAHRVVESACQEDVNDPETFGFAATHWAHILRDIMLAPAGQGLVVWLAKNRDAADRILQTNVLAGHGFGPHSKPPDPVKRLLIHLLAYMSPAIIAQSLNPAEDLAKRLEKFGLEAKALGPKFLVAKGDEGLELPAKFVEFYRKTFPEDLNPDEIRKSTKMAKVVDGLGSFSKVKDLFDSVSLLSDLGAWLTEKPPKENATSWERLEKAKSKLETPVKLAQFLNDKRRALIRNGVETQKGYSSLEDLKFEGQLADKMIKEAPVALEGADEEIIAASRSLRALRYSLGLKGLLGSLSFVVGAANVLLKFHETQEQLEAGNTGKAVGSGFEYLGNVMLVYVTLIEAVNWLASAELLAAGPMGWVAAALIIVGTLLGIFSSERNDLQLFTTFTFLGKQFGEESEQKRPPWMGKLEWKDLKEPRKARVALLRLISSFTTRTGLYASQRTSWSATGVGGIIFPTYIPDGAYFEVEVDWAVRGQVPMPAYFARIWPLDDHYEWFGAKPDDGWIDIIRNGVTVNLIQVHAKPSYSGPKDYIFRTRLLFDSSGEKALPAEGWLENKSVDQSSGGYNDVSTSGG